MSFGQASHSGEVLRAPYPFDNVSKVPLTLNLSTPASPVFTNAGAGFSASLVSGTTYLINVPLSVREILNIKAQLSASLGSPQYGACYCTVPTKSNGVISFYLNITNVTGGAALTLSGAKVFLEMIVTTSPNPQFGST